MVDSSIEIATLSFRIVDSSIDQTRIASFASHSQDQRGIGRSILHRKKKTEYPTRYRPSHVLTWGLYTSMAETTVSVGNKESTSTR